MVERGIENPCVGGSTPSLATTSGLLLALVTLAACGDQCLTCDRCERLCVDVGESVAACLTDELSWQDLGARSETDFVRTCRDDWDEVRADLTSRELELAIDVCDAARDDLGTLDCDEVVGLYAP